jgi:hypothetical protein
MTGYSPSWQRYLYYRLSWSKPSAEELNILRRYRQDYDSVNGWTGEMVKESIRIEIRRSPPSPRAEKGFRYGSFVQPMRVVKLGP